MFFKTARKGENSFWQYLLTFLLVFVGYFVGQIPLMAVIFPKVGADGMEAFAENMDFKSIGMDTNIGFILLLMPFIAALLALWFCIVFFHKRSLRDLITSNSSINWSKVFFSFFLWIGMGILLEIVSYGLDPSNYVFNFNASRFFILILISVLILPLQTSFEELFFRGYLLQGIGLATKSRLIPLIVTSLFFGAVHLLNPEIAEYGLGVMYTYYFSVGLFLGILTVMDDSLELALGIHAATNLYGALFISFKGSALQTDTLFYLNEVNITLMLPLFLASALIFTIICYKKYNWPSFQKLFQAIDLDPESSDLQA